MTTFNDAIAWRRCGADLRWEGAIPETWLQGRTAFGGLSGAIGLRVMREAIADERPPRSVDVAFVAPVVAGPASATVEILRRGRNLTQASARIVQEGAVRAVISGVFAGPRPSAVRVDAEVAAPPLPVAEARELPFIPGVTPTFTQHLDLRWADGGFPFSGHHTEGIAGYCRHRTPADGVEALLALVDAWPAPVLPLLDRPTPASTVRWTVHLIGEPPASDAYCWLRSTTIAAGDGYATTVARLHGPDGELLAWAEQLVAIFDEPKPAAT
ncbi:MAG: thioesterase family protein [Nannocystaceae bacterium]